MHLMPRDHDKLVLHSAGVLAQKRLARGLRLNYPEAVALISSQLLELIRDGHSVSELMDMGRRMLGRANVMAGVPEMVPEVQVEGTFVDGTKLVTVHAPIGLAEGDLALALYGSFLPLPDAKHFRFDPDESEILAGQVFIEPGDIVLNAERDEVTIQVKNMGDRPIQVGSHFPFSDANRALEFDRARSVGMRLGIPAGTAVRFEPGEEKAVTLVATVRSSTQGWETPSKQAFFLAKEAESSPSSRVSNLMPAEGDSTRSFRDGDAEDP